METGYDIIFFWVSRMIMMGLYNMHEAPFRYVYLHGIIRDEQGKKMSKTRGNVIDPLIAADKFGADALRFALATGGGPGNDFRLYDEKLESGRNFANKIWNAARFVIQSIGDEKVRLPEDKRAVEKRRDWPLEDRWIASRVEGVARETNRLLTGFEFNEAGRLLYDFFWSEYCDWYLEMAKVRLKDSDRTPLPVLVYALQSTLRLLHPFMPFVTEAIWQYLRDHVADLAPEALIIAPYPLGEGATDAEAEEAIAAVIDVVRAIRNIRAERGVDPGRYVEAYIASDGPSTAPGGALRTGARPVLEAARPILETLARVRPLHLVDDSSAAPSSGVASAVLDSAQVVLPLAGLIDLGEERRKLGAQLKQAQDEVARTEAKLANEAFTSRAPKEVAAKEEERLAAARSRAEALQQRLAELG
jgi:valyl-tRNA synthetase